MTEYRMVGNRLWYTGGIFKRAKRDLVRRDVVSVQVVQLSDVPWPKDGCRAREFLA